MRERSSGGMAVGHSVDYDFLTNPGNSFTRLQGTATKSRIPYHKVTRDTVTPGYHAKKAAGDVLPVNPFESYEKHESHLPGKVHIRTEPLSTHVSSVDPYDHIFEGQFTANQAQAALRRVPFADWPSEAAVQTRALAKVNTQALDVGTFAAELGKTTRMLVTAKKRLVNLIPRLLGIAKKRKRPMLSPAQVISELNQAWLELRYGWRPLYYDMQEISASINAMDEIRSELERTSAFDFDENRDTFETTQLGSILPGRGAPFVPTSSVHVYSRKSRRVTLGARSQVLSNIGYIDPVTTAWELIPFSFIIDWFINVGDYLQSVSPFISREVVYASLVNVEEYSVRWETSYSRPSRIYAGYTSRVVENQPAVGFLSFRSKERSRIHASSRITANVQLSVPKLIDIWALIWQSTYRRR